MEQLDRYAQGESHARAGVYTKEVMMPWKVHARAGFWQDLWREEPMLELVYWQDLRTCGGPTLEQSSPDGLHPMEVTLADPKFLFTFEACAFAFYKGIKSGSFLASVAAYFHIRHLFRDLEMFSLSNKWKILYMSSVWPNSLLNELQLN